MVADRAGTSGSCQALLMIMRVASPVGRRIARVLLVRPFAALLWQAVHCHLVRSHSAFAIVADGFDRTSFHGFLAKRLLLRGGRLLKHIGVAAVVAAREISGCGFPAQVAVNALVIDVKLSGHVFRVFTRNVGHKNLCRFMQTEIRLERVS
jgi:hypothetical protein